MSVKADPGCLFCRIVSGEIPCERLYEDDHILAFADVNPQAPFHGLVIPKEHLATLDEFDDAQARLAGRLMLVAKELAAERGLRGYRVAMNVNREGGQVIFHAHLHVLGGRQMKGSLG
ncbi:histidine triad nucleotide-binding protein [Candidatus Rariloculus sp.]|uniref:histidine triad nucleotide-binding protein n=1 Tax=Candidatus Rariloculus sp. TaxID=3101265 RepID=UPI003D127B85